MAMIKCRNCGRNVSDTDKTCPYCSEVIEKKPKCAKCGSEDLEFKLSGTKSVYTCNACNYKFTIDQNGDVKDYVGAKEEDFNLFTAYFSMFKRMFRFKGRARRKEYWLAMLMNSIVGGVLYGAMVVSMLFAAVEDTGVAVAIVAAVISVVNLLYNLAVLPAALALEIRRLHDTGRAWHAIFVTLIPLVGQYLLLWYMIEDSQIGANEYGPNPKGLE